KTHIDHLDRTFHQVVLNVAAAEREEMAVILNPIVGPEPIAGSTRMKSGTTTKIILETLALMAFSRHNCELGLTVHGLVSMYRDVCQAVYDQAESLGQLIQIAGESLRCGGHLYYLGCDGVGLMGIIDASECRPTFGAAFDDIRGFVQGGIKDLDSHPISAVQPKCEDSIKSSCFSLHISIDICPAIALETISNQKATAVIMCEEESSMKGAPPEPINAEREKILNMLGQLAQEAAMKWTVNCVSTGAHILLGKVYRNLMVDVRVSNVKLLYRACGIIQDVCSLKETESWICLLKSIYGTDSQTTAQTSTLAVNHVLAAAEINKIVPTAILLGLTNCSVEHAHSLLDKEPNLSIVLKDLLPDK
ncbi:N-acetylmuramic acid 6-phosphate etherase, partial [Plakobranchus ocellatus]